MPEGTTAPPRGATRKWLKRMAIGIAVGCVGLAGLFLVAYDWPSPITAETFAGRFVAYDIPETAPDWAQETQMWTADGYSLFHARGLFNPQSAHDRDRKWWVEGNIYCEQTITDEVRPPTFCYKVWISDRGTRIRLMEIGKHWLFRRSREGTFVTPGTVPRVTK